MFASAGPIHNFDEDLFGYGQFARVLAKSVVDRSNITEPYVVGIDAAWGMGKTSAAHLIRRAFTEIGSEDPSDERRVHVIEFQPWLFSSLDALAVSYMGELTGALTTSFQHRLGPDWKSLRRRLLKRFGGLLSASAGGVAGFYASGAFGPVSAAAKALLEVSDASTEQLGRELWQKLQSVGAGQIVVIVDDVDRLHPDEMRHLLTLITTFGNLPRITHLLLYDRNIVDGAMRRSLGHGADGGPTYLEKIVQLPCALPIVDRISLRDFLLNRLRQSCEISEDDEVAVRELWRDFLRSLLTTPREIARLTNALAVTWRGIAEHAEFLDFLAIEALRLVRPTVWERLRENRHVLVGELDLAVANGNIPDSNTLAPDQTDQVRSLIEKLFPLTSRNNELRQELARRGQRAICARESVDVYFQFTPGNVVPRSFLDDMLEGADAIEFSRRLLVIGRDEVRSLIDDLADRLANVAMKPEEIFRSIVAAADRLIYRPVQTPPAFADIEVFRELDELAWRALRSTPEQEREGLIEDTIANSPSVAMPSVVWQRLALRGGFKGYKTDRPEILITVEAIERLGNILAGRLRRSSAEQSFEHTPLLGWVLQNWRLTGAVEGLNDVANRMALRDIGLVNILDGLMGHAVGSDRGHYRSVRENAGVANLTREQLQALAANALARPDFPTGIDELEIREIARQIVSSYVDEENAW
jgi:hypothetical protein